MYSLSFLNHKCRLLFHHVMDLTVFVLNPADVQTRDGVPGCCLCRDSSNPFFPGSSLLQRHAVHQVILFIVHLTHKRKQSYKLLISAFKLTSLQVQDILLHNQAYLKCKRVDSQNRFRSNEGLQPESIVQKEG